MTSASAGATRSIGNGAGEILRIPLIAADGTTTSLEGVADFAKISAWLNAQPAACK